MLLLPPLKNLSDREQTSCGRPLLLQKCFAWETGPDKQNLLRKWVLKNLRFRGREKKKAGAKPNGVKYSDYTRTNEQGFINRFQPVLQVASYKQPSWEPFSFSFTSRVFLTCRIQNPDIPRAGRGGAAHGRAGRGRRRFGSPRRHLSLVPTRVPKTTVLNVSSEARTV